MAWKLCWKSVSRRTISSFSAWFIVHKGGALSRAESWSASCLHPFDDFIPSQRISELLARLSEDERQRFLSLWLAHVQENDWLCCDITSVSSYARHKKRCLPGKLLKISMPTCSRYLIVRKRQNAGCGGFNDEEIEKYRNKVQWILLHNVQ